MTTRPPRHDLGSTRTANYDALFHHPAFEDLYARVLHDVADRRLDERERKAAAAEILKIAVVLAFRRGLRVCGALHDALVVECPVEEIAEVKAQLVAVMQEASVLVLREFELAVDAKEFVYPNHFHDERGVETWNAIREEMGWSK